MTKNNLYQNWLNQMPITLFCCSNIWLELWSACSSFLFLSLLLSPKAHNRGEWVTKLSHATRTDCRYALSHAFLARTFTPPVRFATTNVSLALITVTRANLKHLYRFSTRSNQKHCFLSLLFRAFLLNGVDPSVDCFV